MSTSVVIPDMKLGSQLPDRELVDVVQPEDIAICISPSLDGKGIHFYSQGRFPGIENLLLTQFDVRHPFGETDGFIHWITPDNPHDGVEIRLTFKPRDARDLHDLCKIMAAQRKAQA